jgi:hypothetical protein
VLPPSVALAKKAHGTGDAVKTGSVVGRGAAIYAISRACFFGKLFEGCEAGFLHSMGRVNIDRVFAAKMLAEGEKACVFSRAVIVIAAGRAIGFVHQYEVGLVTGRLWTTVEIVIGKA